MYHRVIPRKEAAKGIQAGMYVEPTTFRCHLQFLRKYLRIVAISEISSLSKGSFENLNAKPCCVLTFDDGWYDFYEYAFPILQDYQIPATVFLPTDFIGTRDWFWTDRLASLLSEMENFGKSTRRSRSSSSSLMNQLLELKGSYEIRLEKAINLLKTHRNNQIEEMLSELAQNGDLHPYPLGRAFLSWEEIKEMAQSGIVTFGSHTASHRILTTLQDNEIKDEMTKSREKLIAKKAVDSSFIPFSYPNGDYDEKIAKMAKEVGYSLGVTTHKGWNHYGSDAFNLRRIAIHQDIASTEAMLGCRIIDIF
jgi:peptidoglycan/xylan/chitin deacetylase (PgdA/CDA1 family)